MDVSIARTIIKNNNLSDNDIAILILQAQKKAANHHFWKEDDNPTEEELQKFYDRYEMEIYELAKAMHSSDARGGLISYSELGVSRSWGETGQKTVDSALSSIPPKTYVL